MEITWRSIQLGCFDELRLNFPIYQVIDIVQALRMSEWCKE